jgi:hypothetical protein
MIMKREVDCSGSGCLVMAFDTKDTESPEEIYI